MAQQRKCPLGAWLDILSRSEHSGATDGDVDMDASGPGISCGLVPWAADPEEATERVAAVSPELAVLEQRQSDSGRSAQMGKAVPADVHATLRSLIAEATDVDRLQLMPSAWQPWL